MGAVAIKVIMAATAARLLSVESSVVSSVESSRAKTTAIVIPVDPASFASRATGVVKRSVHSDVTPASCKNKHLISAICILAIAARWAASGAKLFLSHES